MESWIMDNLFFLSVFSLFMFIVYKLFKKLQRSSRRKHIDSFRFPTTVTTKLREKYPHLNEQQTDLVIKALREYFHLCNLAGRKMVSMPSQAVDVAWHEFILFTRKYDKFCQQSFGRFLHHTPAEAMSSPTLAQDGIKRAWRLACSREEIKSHKPNRLPLIFALDSDLDIPDGFRYQLDCSGSPSKSAHHGPDIYCASHIGCSSGCGGSSCGGDSGSDGCGGGGCGGD